MTNLPATFQGMMNEILQNMINKRKVAAFVDDMLVRTEMEDVTVVLWTSSHILYGLPFYQKGDVSKATC